MKSITKYLSLTFLLLIGTYCQAQEISINISGEPAILSGKSSKILASICNEDPGPVTIPAYKFASRITVTPGIIISNVTNADGSVLTGWEITHNLSLDSSEVELLNALPLPNAECISFNIVIKATKTADSATIMAQLVFPQKLTGPNGSENDISISRIAIQSQETARLPAALPSTEETTEGNILFPNPLTADKKLNVNTFDIDKIRSVKISDTAGKLLQKTRAINQINTTRLGPGTYIVTITYKDGTTTAHRVVKQ